MSWSSNQVIHKNDFSGIYNLLSYISLLFVVSYFCAQCSYFMVCHFISHFSFCDWVPGRSNLREDVLMSAESIQWNNPPSLEDMMYFTAVGAVTGTLHSSWARKHEKFVLNKRQPVIQGYSQWPPFSNSIPFHQMSQPPKQIYLKSTNIQTQEYACIILQSNHDSLSLVPIHS